MTRSTYSQGGDAQVIAEIAARHFGGFTPMFEHHKWPERGSDMMRKVQTRVRDQYGSVKVFEEKYGRMHSDIVRDMVKDYCDLYHMPQCVIHNLSTPAEIWRERTDVGGAGCYAIYNKNKQLRYIGSSYTIRKRACDHFTRRVQKSQFWTANPAAFIQLIETREHWEHWSLESYLTFKTRALRKLGELPEEE